MAEPSPIILREGAFIVFSLLPFELRQDIWQHALLPQFVELLLAKHDHSNDFDPPPSISPWKHIIPGQRTKSPLFFACKESRSIAMEHYDLGLRMRTGRLHHRDYKARNSKPCQFDFCDRRRPYHWQVAFNPHCDVLFMREINPLNKCGSRSACQKKYIELFPACTAQYLAIDHCMFENLHITLLEGIILIRTIFVVVNRQHWQEMDNETTDMYWKLFSIRDIQDERRWKETKAARAGHLQRNINLRWDNWRNENEWRKSGTRTRSIEVVLVDSKQDILDEMARRFNAAPKRGYEGLEFFLSKDETSAQIEDENSQHQLV